MVLAGTLDRHPQLRIVIGHMGEMLPMMLARIDAVSALDVEHLQRPISRGGGEERALRLVSVQHTNALFALASLDPARGSYPNISNTCFAACISEFESSHPSQAVVS
jgi:hypothetical protein